MMKVKFRFSKGHIEFYGGKKIPLQDLDHVWFQKYGVKRGSRFIYARLKMFKVIDEWNEPLPPYDTMRLFGINKQGIHNPYGKQVAEHNQLLLTLRGIVFVGRFLQLYKDVKLKREKKKSIWSIE